MKLTEKLSLISELENQIQNNSINEEEVYSLIVKVAKLISASDRGSLFKYSTLNKQLESLIAEGLSSKIYVDLGEGIVGRSAQNQEILVEHDVDTTKNFNSDIDLSSGYVTCNTLTVPILGKNEMTLGVIQVLNKAEGNYDEKDEELLLSVANITSLYLENNNP